MQIRVLVTKGRSAIKKVVEIRGRDCTGPDKEGEEQGVNDSGQRVG